MNKPSNKHEIVKRICRAMLLVAGIALFATAGFAQETGGELGGGAGIFRPKNPEAKRTGGPPKPVRPKMSPAELEAHFQDALADGNDARDERKFALSGTTAPPPSTTMRFTISYVTMSARRKR